MSLYNLLHGVNPHAGMLLSFLGITPGDVPRFRDCYAENGKIVIHTRTGGGNRSYYEHPDAYKNETGEDGNGPWNSDLRKLPGFDYDKDDDFDCTYASFYFTPAPDVAKLVEQISALGGDDPAEKWRKLLADMEAGRDNPRVARALEVGKAVIDAITTAHE